MEQLNNLHLTDGLAGAGEEVGKGLNGRKNAVVAGLGRGRSPAPSPCRILTPLPPNPSSAVEGEGMQVPCGKLRARARHTRVRARLYRWVCVYPCVRTWVCSCDSVAPDPSMCVLHACERRRVDGACECTAVCMCLGMRATVGDVYTPAWVKGAVCMGGFVHLYMHVGVQTGVCISALCTVCSTFICRTAVYGCVPCCVHVSVCTLRLYHVI